MIKPVALVAALMAASALDGSSAAQTLDRPQSQDRYALELSVYRDGIVVVAGRTLIVEDLQAEMSLSDGDLPYQLNADLSPIQGDGDPAMLSLNVNLSHGDDQPLSPSLIVRRGGTARVETGEQNAAGDMINGTTLTLTPVAPARS